MAIKRISASTKVLLACLLALGLFFSSTEPRKLPTVILVVPFILFFVTILIVIRFFIDSLRVALLVSAFPTLLVVLRSLGQLTLRDIITTAALFGIAYFYLERATGRSST